MKTGRPCVSEFSEKYVFTKDVKRIRRIVHRDFPDAKQP